MGSIYWIASYPKSVGTSLPALFASYLSADAVDAASRTLFDEWSGVQASALDEEIIERLRPQIYRCAARHASGLLFLKTHDMFRRAPDGESLFPADSSSGVIYLVRNVLDIADSLSLADAAGKAAAVDELCSSGHAIACSAGRLNSELRQITGSWSEHVRSWTEQRQIPVCLIRYEDLLRNPEEEFSRISRFCGLVPDAVRLRQAVSHFREMQHQQPAGSRNSMDTDLLRRLAGSHGEVMHRIGYPLET